MGKKTEMISLRVSAEAKEQLRQMAAKERRSVSNMLETLILDSFGRKGAKAVQENKEGEDA